MPTAINDYQAPVPHPEILRGFDELVLGAAEQLIKLAENESLHRHLNKKSVTVRLGLS